MLIPTSIPRLPRHVFFMLEAHLIATRSTCDRGPELLFDPGRHGVGCVVVRDGRVIAGGYNGSPPREPHCGELRCSYCRKSLPIGKEGFVDLDGAVLHHKDLLGKKHRNCPVPYPNDNYETLPGEWEGGHLMIEGHCRRTLHSETNALIQCALDGVSPSGATIFTTASPCYDCAKIIIRAQIKAIYVGEQYESRYGLSGQVQTLLRECGVNMSYLDCKNEKVLKP